MGEVTVKHNKELITRATIGTVVAYFVVFGALLLILGRNNRLADITLSCFYVIPILSAFISCLWASRKSKLYKRLWSLISVGMFMWMLGASTVSFYMVTLGPSNIPFPSMADVFSAAYLPIVIAIMFSLGRIRFPLDTEKKQFLVNTAMMALTMLLLLYEFILVPTWYSNPDMSVGQRLFTIAYPVFDWVILVSLLLASRRLMEKRIEGWIIFLISAFTCSVLADIPVYVIGYQMNYITIFIMVVAAVFMSMAAIDEVTGVFIGIRRRSRTQIKGISSTQSLTQNRWQTLAIPLAAVFTIPVILLYALSHMRVGEIYFLMIISTLVTALSIYRNHLLATDNTALFTRTLRDSLTGLNNHRCFHETLEKATQRSDKITSLLIIDIDDFSKVNDAKGHTFGDGILATIGGIISAEIGEEDEAFRLSGDEFAVILPRTDTAEAFALSEKIRGSIYKALSKAFSDTEITTTIGISTYPTLAKDKSELLHTADGALYWAKSRGKNRSFIYDSEVVEVLSAEERAKKAEEATLIDMVRSLAKAVDARDSYTRLHSRRVSTWSGKLARQIGLDEDMVSRIEVAGMLHDIGKIGIPDSILNKPGKLTDDEMSVIKNHPELSSQILKSTSLKDIIPAVAAHHERWDGNGYPNRLKGEDIPVEARVLAIADTFDAMTSDRPYRGALSIDDALREIKKNSGAQFDPQLAEAFLGMFTVSNKWIDFEDDLANNEKVS